VPAPPVTLIASTDVRAVSDTGDAVEIVEVGPRDGLQNEATILDTPTKVEMIRRCIGAGTRRIEVASFVNPKRVPQMADAEGVLDALGPSRGGVSSIGLVLNERGLDRALATGVDEINFVVGASEGINRANAGQLPDETMASIERMLPRAKEAERFTSVTISVAFGCPYDGEVPIETVAALAERSAAAGADEIALGDTIGVAVPDDVVARIEAVWARVDDVALRCHFHDTRNTAVANTYAAYAAGVRVFDASVGGAGGCPFAPSATGNVATEDLLYVFERQGVATGIDPEATIETGRWLGERLGKPLPAALGRAGWFPQPWATHDRG
jgi:hydroxymethylglutaryl-CoA lyase